MQSTEDIEVQRRYWSRVGYQTCDVTELLADKPLPDYWCSVTYYEFEQQVGEAFTVPASYNSFIIDNDVEPSEINRLCLGTLHNDKRTKHSEQVRVEIGKGILLDYRGDGDIWLTCLSDHPVYIQSPFLDREAGREPGDAVHTIYPSACTKVFDLRQCHKHMQQRTATARSALAAEAAAAAGYIEDPCMFLGRSIPRVQTNWRLDDDLRMLCYLCLSFVKGWGPDFYRKKINQTPCWIKISVHRALQLLEEFMPPSPVFNNPDPNFEFGNCSSTSNSSSSSNSSSNSRGEISSITKTLEN